MRPGCHSRQNPCGVRPEESNSDWLSEFNMNAPWSQGGRPMKRRSASIGCAILPRRTAFFVERTAHKARGDKPTPPLLKPPGLKTVAKEGAGIAGAERFAPL